MGQVCQEANEVMAKDAKFLTVKEVAGQLRISEKHTRRLLQDGVLRGIRLGDLWRIPISQIERLEKETRN
jgi:excisionase family DNA binding protein